MKRLIVLLGVFCCLLFVSIDEGISQDLSDIETEELIQQEREISRDEPDLPLRPDTENLIRALEEKPQVDGIRMLASTSIWFSKDPNDLKPLIGTTWKFTFTIISTFTDTITFGTNITTTSDGTVGLSCSNEYGRTGYVFYADLPSGGRGFAAVIEGTILIQFYSFKIDGDTATGDYSFKVISTGSYSNFYPMTGIKINGPPAVDTYSYFLPYFISDSEYWTGVALRNYNSSQGATISVVVYDQNGNTTTSETKTLPSRGQDAFMVGEGLFQEGWIQVNSNQPLAGLSFFGTRGYNNYMADITLIPSLSETLCVPHVAQDQEWDTTILVCNPNNSRTTVTLVFVNPAGNELYSQTYSIPANGSGKYKLDSLVQGTAHSMGSVEIRSSRGVAAFALYRNLKSGGMCYSGISAIAPPPQN